MKSLSKSFAEFLGTFALVFCGTGAIIINQEFPGSVSNLGIAVTFGAIVLAMIYSFGDKSGAHINPAVTLAFWLSGRFSKKQVLPYIASQLLGAIVASLILLLFFPNNEMLGGTQPQLSPISTALFEGILTFFLMLVIIQVSTGSKEVGTMAGIAISSVVMLEAAFAGPITGASMNPARSIAPALASGHLENLWIYIIGPIGGALLAVIAWKILNLEKRK